MSKRNYRNKHTSGYSTVPNVSATQQKRSSIMTFFGSSGQGVSIKSALVIVSITLLLFAGVIFYFFVILPNNNQENSASQEQIQMSSDTNGRMSGDSEKLSGEEQGQASSLAALSNANNTSYDGYFGQDCSGNNESKNTSINSHQEDKPIVPPSQDPEEKANEKWILGNNIAFGSETPQMILMQVNARDNTIISLFWNDSQIPACQITSRTENETVWYAEPLQFEGATGENNTLYVSIERTDGGKADTEILQYQFMICDIPTVSFAIDESLGTIESMNNDPDHITECYGSVSVTVPTDYSNAYTNLAESGVYELDYIRGRGNSTWKSVEGKKPYKVKLDSKANILGLGSGKHWVLLANALDPSLLRNEFSYRLSSDMGMNFAPKIVPVNVIMNGRYYGTYSLVPQVRISSNSVDISELDNESNSEPDITGGYLMSFQSDADDGSTIVKTAHGYAVSSENNLTTEQNEYISQYILHAEAVLFGEEEGDWTDYFDINSAVDYYLLQFVSNNSDGCGGGSTFLYKDRGGKICFGPVWDFDYCPWGANTSIDDYDQFSVTYSWVYQMLADDRFYELWEQRWEVLKDLLEDAIADGGMIDQMSECQYHSQGYNYLVNKVIRQKLNPDWSFDKYIEAGGDPSKMPPMVIPDESATYDGEIVIIKTWTRNRIDWLELNMSSIRNPIA